MKQIQTLNGCTRSKTTNNSKIRIGDQSINCCQITSMALTQKMKKLLKSNSSNRGRRTIDGSKWKIKLISINSKSWNPSSMETSNKPNMMRSYPPTTGKNISGMKVIPPKSKPNPSTTSSTSISTRRNKLKNNSI